MRMPKHPNLNPNRRMREQIRPKCTRPGVILMLRTRRFPQRGRMMRHDQNNPQLIPFPQLLVLFADRLDLPQ